MYCNDYFHDISSAIAFMWKAKNPPNKSTLLQVMFRYSQS